MYDICIQRYVCYRCVICSCMVGVDVYYIFVEEMEIRVTST